MSSNDDDIVKGLGFVTLYSAYLEQQIHALLTLLNEIEPFTTKEQRWPTSKKIDRAKRVIQRLDFEGRDELFEVLVEAKKAFEHRNELVHGRIYGGFDRPEPLKSGRPNMPDRHVSATELYDLANFFSDLRGEVSRPMIFKIVKALSHDEGEA